MGAMGGVIKRKRKKDGKSVTDANWTVRFADANGKWRSIPAFADKHTSEQLKLNIQHLVDLQKGGSGIDADAMKFIATCGKDIRERLAELNIIAPERAAAGEELVCHIDKYINSPFSTKNTPAYVAETRNKLLTLARDCKWKKLSDITAPDFEQWRSDLQKKGKKVKGTSAAKLNRHKSALEGFCKWAVRTKRLSANPMLYVSQLNEDADRRYERRVLIEMELQLLIIATKASDKIIHGLNGCERALLYRTALLTAFRYTELMSLTKADFDLTRATVTIRGEFAKNKKTATNSISPELADELRAWFNEIPDGMPVFKRCADKKGAKMLRLDLAAAGIACKDAGGKVADFHSLRHTAITRFILSGHSWTEAVEYARHSDPKLTRKRYGHLEGNRFAAAIQGLDIHGIKPQAEPALSAFAPDCIALRATGTDDATAATLPPMDSRRDSFSGGVKTVYATMSDTVSKNRSEIRDSRRDSFVANSGETRGVLEQPPATICDVVRHQANADCIAFPPQKMLEKIGAPEGFRTPDLRIRNPWLYPTELPAQTRRVF